METSMNQNRKEEWMALQQAQKKRAYRSLSEKDAYRERKELLLQLKKMLLDHEEECLLALKQDLGNSSVEAYASELAILLNEIDYTLRYLKKWLRPKMKYRFSIGSYSKTSIKPRPYGSVLILSPWNYPLQLSLLPVIGAFAAGNRCFLKPSEYASATSNLLVRLLKKYFESEDLVVVEGDAVVSEELVSLEWDYIFFTGSPAVGKKVHQAASEQTIPVTLELGGKNPCIVDETALSEEYVRRIIWGKFMNAGQTCVAPDTVYVPEEVYSIFLEMAQKELVSLYGTKPKDSADYSRIVNEKHFQRLIKYLEEGTVYSGGEYIQSELYIAPTLLVNIKKKSHINQDEIFGPILPIVPYQDLEELTQRLNSQPDPLVVYLFSHRKSAAEYLEKQLKSGAFSWNQTIRQAASSEIPFGGVGKSGFGRYHGRYSFFTFSYLKPVYRDWILFSFRAQFPPYKNNQLKVLKKMRKWLF